MEQGLIDDNSPRDAEPNLGPVQDQLEALQDDVNLLKIEIKQTLVDLREFMMKHESGFLPASEHLAPFPSHTLPGEPAAEPSAPTGTEINVSYLAGDGPPANSAGPVGSKAPPDASVSAPPISEGIDPQTDPSPAGEHNVQEQFGHEYQTHPISSHQQWPTDTQSAPNGVTHSDDSGINVGMLADLLWWLDSIKGKELTADRIAPFLQAYEAKGSLTPIMAKLILQSVSEIGQSAPQGQKSEFSPQEYKDCLRRLHDIVCNTGPRPEPSEQESAGVVRRVRGTGD